MAEQNTTEQFDNDEISLKELILKIKEWYQFLLTQWKLIILMGVIGGVIGFTYAYFQKPTYKAVLTFALEEYKGGGAMSGALGLASQFGFDIGGSGGGAFAGSNLIELMITASDNTATETEEAADAMATDAAASADAALEGAEGAVDEAAEGVDAAADAAAEGAEATADAAADAAADVAAEAEKAAE